MRNPNMKNYAREREGQDKNMPTSSIYDLSQVVAPAQTPKGKYATKQDGKSTKCATKHVLKRDNKAFEAC